MLLALLACTDAQTEEGPSVFEGASDDGAVSWVLDFGAAPAVGATEATLTQTDADGAPMEVTPSVEPWMPEHGHGVAAPPVVEELGGGVYVATWTWSMSGAWEVLLDADGHEGAVDVVVR